MDGKLTAEELIRGCESFREHEPRDAMYRVATRLIDKTWGDSSEVADALGILLLTWNQAFYRYGPLSCDELERFVRRNQESLNELRPRDLATLASDDEERLESLFDEMLEASLSFSVKSRRVRRSPVSVAKAFHLLAPRFFPLWDDKIAHEYQCKWPSAPRAWPSYLRFMKMSREQLDSLGSLPERKRIEETLSSRARFPKPLLKFIDEHNYARFTKGWIE